MGRTEAQIACYEGVLSLGNEDWHECHFALALAYDHSGRVDAPRKTFEHAKAAIRLEAQLKQRFQAFLRNSVVSRQIATIVSEIIEKCENDQLTDAQTETYARKFQEMLGDRQVSPDTLRDRVNPVGKRAVR